LLQARIEQLVRSAGLEGAVRVVTGQSHTVLAACDATLIASGTATLEAALFKRPMVIGYHMHPLSWWLMRRKQLQPWVGLPNILCGEFVVPELIQDAATPMPCARPPCNGCRPVNNSPKKSRPWSSALMPCTKACNATPPN
jgi:lipid-A-disaccharide synthase